MRNNDKKSLFSAAVPGDVLGSYSYRRRALCITLRLRAYITTVVRQRLHQRGFRERVLRAYREQCALCRLRHYELLDAAHIIPDPEPEGLPSVRNGISLCKFHHAAFETQLLGITPDYTVQIRNDVLEEEDGPMLQHALKPKRIQV